jgi:hypothetical protein
MEILKLIGELIKYAIPAIAAFLTMRYMLEQFHARERERETEMLRREAINKMLPMRLAALERLTLYLERINLQPMVLRAGIAGKTTAMLRAELTEGVVAELEHNLVQQVYVSQPVWSAVLKCKEETLTAINLCAQQVPAESPAIELAQSLLEQFAAGQNEALQSATHLIREEIRKFY